MGVRIFIAYVAVLILISCNYVTYTPRSKRNIQHEKPSIVLLGRIVDFRLEQNSWPFSKEEFINKGKIYREAFEGFPYTYTEFKVIDNNTMIFYFSSHVKDNKNFKKTEKIDLNSYSGHVRFYKENERFLWKLKMN